MTLQEDWDMEEEANVITTIFGYNENTSEANDPDDGGEARNSAIPLTLDDWFHGDFRTDRPDNLSDAFGQKSLEEYDQSFLNHRINTAIEIKFNTDGQTISESQVLVDDSSMQHPTSASPITLEGHPDEPGNPFRNQLDHYDDHNDDDYLEANTKGPHDTVDTVSVVNDDGDTIEGIRGSVIFGGNDTYLVKAKADGITLGSLVPGLAPLFLLHYFRVLGAFYAFLDFVFMADGAQVVRCWDASRYPAHALYLGGDRVDTNVFRENEEWSVDGTGQEAFSELTQDSLYPGRTPFGWAGSFTYEDNYWRGAGPHPVMFEAIDGTSLSASTVEENLPEPLFPPLP